MRMLEGSASGSEMDVRYSIVSGVSYNTDSHYRRQEYIDIQTSLTDFKLSIDVKHV